jgi:tryptophan synthase alpha subunit
MDSHSCIAAAKQLREAGVKVPLLFMGYYNPILTYGIAAYVNDCADAGIDGLIVPDLPAEESEPLHEELHKRDMALIPMLAPTSTDERIALGVAGADGFVYCVSVTGVTGARAAVSVNLEGFIDRVRAHTTLPIVVGFGVAERAHVEAIGKLADAAAVGSALINVIDSAPPEERASRAGAFIAALRGNGA